MRPRPLLAGSTALALSLLLTACSGSPAPTPSPTMVPLRAVDACPATVAIPAEVQQVGPSADQPPTAVLLVGGAVSFAVPAGARVGLIGDADPDDDAGLCAAPADGSGSVTYVATAEGYLRVGVQVGIEPAAKLFVKVTS